MRKFIEIAPKNVEQFKNQVCWASQEYGVSVVLDSNNFEIPDFIEKARQYDFVAGFDHIDQHYDSLGDLYDFHQKHKEWLLGYITYDVKNQVEKLVSNLPDRIELPDLYFFVPRFLILYDKNKWQVGYLEQYDDEDAVIAFIETITDTLPYNEEMDPVKIVPQITHKEYLEAVEELLKHIQRGDIYEINFCMEFFAQNFLMNPQDVYERLKAISPTPFAAFMKYHDKFLLSASPERYFKKCGHNVVSQPIKGTSKREENPMMDKANKDYLVNSPKERAENIMITDLVRNDLSRIAQRGSVKVEELCHVYSFSQVHQMISTISAHLKDDLNWVDVIKGTFPMGSMTGAPKVNAMKLSEQYEKNKRGLYSGAVGYVTPEGDCDFNVVIRSVLYNQKKKAMSFMVGGAVTAQSEPQKEYDECMLKASAIMALFNIEK